ncbi:MAG: DUF3153 domain-containing protein [Oscillatoria sp. PMC 1068.18]|nr:DUF3153 domain-containing protein [Oscillatoria sp. PMC 1076.18]MEC4989342.1 DUF3153 domain-containing protein [Oscillatoria sp. PMC 1068.18]
MSSQKKNKHPLVFLLPLVLSLVTLLTGCVNYDLGVNFNNSHQGTITQRIKLGEQLTSFSTTDTQQWLNSVERRAQQLGGQAKQLSPQEVEVSIPFSNLEELETKFNDFFNPENTKEYNSARAKALDLVELNAVMQAKANNLLFFQRNRLSLTIDLRALGVIAEQDNIVISPDSLVELDFRLRSPGKIRTITSINNGIAPEVTRQGNELVWQLQPGQINYIETIFWLPDYLGLGTVVIVLLMLLGFWLKYKHFPWQPTTI